MGAVADARLDYAARSFKCTEPMLGELSMKPSDYLRWQVRVTPFPGEDVAELVKISCPELYLFSSDYPHPEGTNIALMGRTALPSKSRERWKVAVHLQPSRGGSGESGTEAVETSSTWWSSPAPC